VCKGIRHSSDILGNCFGFGVSGRLEAKPTVVHRRLPAVSVQSGPWNHNDCLTADCTRFFSQPALEPQRLDHGSNSQRHH
jgi:hypothetical protein